MSQLPVYLDASKCNGCVSCMKRCPTEAIRVREGKAKINYERCVGCGECVKVCQTRAKIAQFDKLNTIYNYRYKVALPHPALYGQFNNLSDTNFVLNGLKNMGFDEVFEVAVGAEMVSEATRELVKTTTMRPIISSACPAIVKLIQMRYEHLIEHLSPILSIEEVTARYALDTIMARGKLSRGEIGIFVISPCSSKVLSLSEDSAKGLIDGVLSVKEIYFPLLAEMNRITAPDNLRASGKVGVSWGSSAGEAMGIGTENYLIADGIENVISVLNELEHDKLSSLDFLELNACSGGCVGGILNIENPHLARTRLRILRKSMPVYHQRFHASEDCNKLYRKKPYEINNVFKLSDDRVEAMRRMTAVNAIYAALPQIDCGSCGAPNCMAFAEDLVGGMNVQCKFRDILPPARGMDD